MTFYIVKDKEIFLNLKVTPKASSSRIGNLIDLTNGNQALKIYVTAVAEKGKANKAVIELIAKSFGITKTDIQIVSGETEHNKVIKISNQIEKLLNSLKWISLK